MRTPLPRQSTPTEERQSSSEMGREPPKLKPSDLSMIVEEGEASNVEDLLRNVSGSQLNGVGEEEKTQPEHEEQEGLEREQGS